MERLKFLFRPYGAILFLKDSPAGVIVMMLTFLLPSIGILALTALISTILFAEFIGVRDEYLKYGFYLYNSLLVGMGVGYYYEISYPILILTIFLAILTFLVSFGLKRIFFKYSLPLLSLPFVIVSTIFYLAAFKYTNLLSSLLTQEPLIDIDLLYLSPFLKSLGAIIFLPYNIAGLVVAILLLYYSRILFFSAILGFGVGVWFHSFFIPFDDALASPYNFNFILISMALSGVFLVPHIKNIILAITAVIIAVIFTDAVEIFFNNYSLPVYAIPFNIITLLFIMLLFAIGYRYFNYSIQLTPEKSLSYFLSYIYRFGGNDIKIALPFRGEWVVYQGFNGEWTHKGSWRYAYDFIIKKDGKSYRNDGLFLEDYYAFGQSVLSPINGYVVALRDDLEDNFIGSVDRLNSWGNYIIIQSEQGYYVEISHLMKNSIGVKVGEYVLLGQAIARCGNSGYSPQPHIHIQVQASPLVGASTLFFRFIDYIKDEQLFYYSNPKEGERIEAPIIDRSMQLRFTFVLDEHFRYSVYKGDKKVDEVEFEVKMNELGEFYFKDLQANRLYFFSDSRLFYFYKYEGKEGYLKELFKLAPRVPFVNKELFYKDLLPLEVRYKGVKRVLMELIIPFNYKFFNRPIKYFKKTLEVSSAFGRVGFSFYEKGFEIIELKDMVLKRSYEISNG